MKSRFRFAYGIAILWISLFAAEISARSLQPAAVLVEPGDLIKRDDLIGRDVIVDDRLRYFQFHPGEGFDEILLKRTPVIFRLPRPLRPQSSPGNPAVQVRGVLRRDGEQMVCDVTSFQLFPSDLDRLERSVAKLASDDFRSRKDWSAWALQRARAFDDKPLRQKALQIEGDAIRIESNSLRGDDLPRVWMRLAEEARRRDVPEPEPSSLAHKALRVRLGSSSTIKELDDLVASIERFFPKAKERGAGPGGGSGSWDEEYAKDPGNAYRKAPADMRLWLDRSLWLDAVEKRYRAMAKDNPRSAIDLALKVEAQIPERKDLMADLRKTGVADAARNVGSYRLSEVKAVSQTIREKFQQPMEAENLLRDWLKLQRSKLSDTDADGKLSLATRYEELVGDRAKAIELIRQAWKADPGSKEVAQAFRTRGFRKVGDDWVEDGSRGNAAVTTLADGSPSFSPTTDAARSGLRGLDSAQVLQRLGNKPDRVVFCGSKGRLVEQWIYVEPRQIRYVNFIRTPNELKARVISDYSLLRAYQEGLNTPPPKTSSPR